MFVALGIQHAMPMRDIISSFANCLALQYFSTLFLKWLSFGEKCYITQNMCFLFSLQLLSEIFLILTHSLPAI